MARFVHKELGLASAAAIHDGDPYSQSIAQAFADNFSELGGTVTAVTAVNKEDTDMLPVLTEVATGSTYGEAPSAPYWAHACDGSNERLERREPHSSCNDNNA